MIVMWLLQKYVAIDKQAYPIGIYDDIIKGKHSNGDVGRWTGNMYDGYYTEGEGDYYSLTAFPLNNGG